MKFTLIIDEHKPEEVVVTAHKRSDLTDKIEALVWLIIYLCNRNTIGRINKNIHS